MTTTEQSTTEQVTVDAHVGFYRRLYETESVTVEIPAGLADDARDQAIEDAVAELIAGGNLALQGDNECNCTIIDIMEDGADEGIESQRDVRSPDDLWWLSETEQEAIETWRNVRQAGKIRAVMVPRDVLDTLERVGEQHLADINDGIEETRGEERRELIAASTELFNALAVACALSIGMAVQETDPPLPPETVEYQTKAIATARNWQPAQP